MTKKRIKSSYEGSEPPDAAESTATKSRRILRPPSLPVILDAAEEETGKSINCGFSDDEMERLTHIIPNMPTSTCHRLDRLVYFWKVARDDAENATSPDDARLDAERISHALGSDADSLDELLANQNADSYTNDGYSALMKTVKAMRDAKSILVKRLSKVQDQNGKAGRPDEYTDLFTWQVEQILQMDDLSLIYFDQRYEKNRPHIKLLKFICECAEFRKTAGMQENRKYTKLIDGLGLPSCHARRS